MPIFAQPSRNCVYGLLVAFAAGIGAALAFSTGAQVVGHLALTVVISVAMWMACDPFADAAQWVGRRLRIPGSVRGATLDAIASSMPELSVGILFVYEFNDFGASIATCAGSAVYNMILIPALCGLAISFHRKEQPYIRIGREVLVRDGFWFLLSETVLIVLLFYGYFEWWAAVILLALYVGYLVHLYRDAKGHRRLDKQRREEAIEAADDGDNTPRAAVRIFGGAIEVPLNLAVAIMTLVVSTAIVIFASHYLVDSCQALSQSLNVPSFFIAVIVVAAASSMPDTMISLGAAMRGDDSGAVSNAFGSNTFDVNVCLSLPILIYVIRNSGAGIHLQDSSGILVLGGLLWVLSALTLFVVAQKYRIGRPRAIVLILLYLIFIGYAVLGSLGVVAGVG